MDSLSIHPVTPERWSDLLLLFGPSGAYSNCWCTWWLLTGKEWDETPKEQRRALLEGLVVEGHEPGLLAYRDGEPVGWCALGPRERYAKFVSPRARVYKQFDDRPSWVINCFYIHKEHRGTGVATALLEAALDYARSHGVMLVEGYPIDQAVTASTSATLFVGTLTMFEDAGFEEVGRVGGRPLVRKELPHQ